MFPLEEQVKQQYSDRINKMELCSTPNGQKLHSVPLRRQGGKQISIYTKKCQKEALTSL